jgi:hypothetical protein
LIEEAEFTARESTFIRFDPIVSSNVKVQIPLLLELLPTNMANVVLLIRVRYHVLLIARDVTEPLATDFAFKREFARVNPLMLSETSHGPESQLACFYVASIQTVRIWLNGVIFLVDI